MALKYRQTFRVVGAFRFPIDMLRYDSAFPASEQDSGKILETFNLGGARQPVNVKLHRYVRLKGDYPTVDRWKSFLWTVDENTVETEPCG